MRAAITNFGCTYFVIWPDTGIKNAMASPPGNNTSPAKVAV